MLRSSVPDVAFLLMVAVVATACARAPGTGEAALEPASAPIRSDRIEVRETPDHPRLTLVERLGDPKPALALAVAHDHGSVASVALSTLLEARLSERGYPTTTRQAHALGFQLATLVKDPKDAERFVLAARAALDLPVTPGERGLELVAKELVALEARRLTRPGERAVADCSGELGVAGADALLDVRSDSGRAKLESWRQELVRSGHLSLAAVGSRELLDRVASSHRSSPGWASSDGPDDPWPERDVSSIGSEPGAVPMVSLALRVADASRAIQAASALAHEDSRLKRQLAALVPAWSLARSIATARVRGACLRLDMELERGAPSVVEEVARVAFLAEREARLALQGAESDSFVLDQRVLMAPDPRQAAALGAWRAHVSRQPTGRERRALSVLARPNLSARAEPELEALLRRYHEGEARDTEQKSSVEPGQGEVWMLLASRCGTQNEAGADAGHSALVMHALARRANLGDGVSIEPWVGHDAVGLLAHAPPQSVSETAAALAERVGRALAEAFASTPVTFQHTSEAREQLLDLVGPEPRAIWWQTVSALSPGHPSWLVPWGTFHSLSEASRSSLERRHQALLGEPLRAAVIANQNQAQAEAGLTAMKRWLSPLRGAKLACHQGSTEPVKPGRLEFRSLDAEPDLGAYIGMQTPPDGAAARATEYLLNRKAGWLEQALAVPGLVTSARAWQLGGPFQRALVIEVRALDDKTHQAVEQVRALLERLAQGASTQADVKLAERHLEAEATLSALNPRGRIARLWQGTAETKLTLQRLRSFQRALAGQNHLVVTRKPSE